MRVARDEPRRYGKNGELLIDYENTEEHAARSGSVAHDKPRSRGVENVNEMGGDSAESSASEKRGTDMNV